MALTGRDSYRKWNQQQQDLQTQIDDLAQDIQTASNADEAQPFIVRRQQLIASKPSLEKIRWGWLLAASLLYGGSLIPGGLVLHEASRLMGYRLPLGPTMGAQVLGHLGKYVPGKAVVVVIRTGKLHDLGVPLLRGSVAVFLETIFMMAVGAALAGGLIFALPVSRWIAWAALLGGLSVTLPTIPRFLRLLVDRVVRKQRSKQTAGTENGKDSHLPPIEPSWRFFIAAWCWQLLAWLMIGACFAMVVRSLPGWDLLGYSETTVLAASMAAIALAMVVGFVSLLPGGAGIRELVLAIILAPVVGQPVALVAAISARVIFIVVEVLAAGLVWAVNRHSSPPKTA